MRNILYTLLLLAVAQINASAQTDTLKKSIVHLGLIYPISTNGRMAASYDNDFSLNIFAGISGREEACSISGISTIVKGNAQGAQVAGIANLIGNNASGVQVAGITNIIKSKTEGVQVAGIINLTDTLRGIQVAGLVNIAKHTTDGVQVAGLTNHATDVNVQTSGIFNQAQKVNGVQIAAVNDATTVQGAQISGLVNKAKKVKGIQIGFINIADTGDYAIGAINLLGNGSKSVSIAVDEMGTTTVAFRSGGRKLYSIIGIGYNNKVLNGSYSLESGLGYHIRVSNPLLINIEAVHTSLTNFKQDDYFKSGIRVLAAYKITNSFEIFAGPSVNAIFPSKATEQYVPGVLTWDFKTNNTKWNVGLGGIVGLQLGF